MSLHLVELVGVRKSYFEAPVLRDLSLTLDRGHFYVLVGQNGAGKSTLMRILLRQEAFQGGRGTICGHPLDEDTPEINGKVAYVSEAIQYAVGGSIRKFFAYYAGFFPRWDEKLFAGTLGELGIELGKGFHELSRGQRMQVAFAAAIATRPELLLLDEITAVLDARARAHFMAYLAGYARDGGTVLMATNIVSEAHPHADRLILLDGGRVAVESPIAELSGQFQRLRKPAWLEHPVFAHPEVVPIGIHPDDDSLLYLARRELPDLREAPAEAEDPRRVTAEDVFVYYTRKKAA